MKIKHLSLFLPSVFALAIACSGEFKLRSCPPGQVPDDAKEQCVPCEAGTVADSESGKCNACPTGQAPDASSAQCVPSNQAGAGGSGGNPSAGAAGSGDPGGAGGTGGSAGGAGGGIPLGPALIAGGYHTCVQDQGVARCWGDNQYGQLGNSANVGMDAANPTPTLVDGGVLATVRQLALGNLHTCALRDDGRVLCWGYNDSGQLGNGVNIGMGANAAPTLVDDSALGVVHQLALGDYHSCALRDDGRVLCWGFNRYGQLGNGTNVNTDAATPTPTLVDDSALGAVRQLVLGGNHSCALRDDGRVLCWGSNSSGQLGNLANVGTNAANAVPTLVDDSALGVVRQLALGYAHTCALRDDGRVLCWGFNRYGQLGNGANIGTNAANAAPTLVDDSALGVVRQLAVGNRHSCAVRDDGRVLCWGLNDSGQLGSLTNAGTDVVTPAPALVDGGALATVRHIALNYGHSCALRDDGRVLCWGSNDSGQLGSLANAGSTTANPAPRLVESLAPLTP